MAKNISPIRWTRSIRRRKRPSSAKQSAGWMFTSAGRSRTSFRRSTPLVPPFRQEVWALLLQIPYGQTTTYGALAKQLAAMHGLPRMSAQAVGGAVGHNEISIIIPCHRVVGTNGNLTGYAGGIDKKAKLLMLEKIRMEHLFPPTNYSLTPSTR